VSGTASDAPDDRRQRHHALGWQGDFATGFFEFLATQRNVPAKTLDARDLDASQCFVAGFLVASANPLDLKPLDSRGQGVWRMKGVELLQQAAKELPNDFAVQYALALVQAQALMSNAKAWCQVFRVPDAVLQHFPGAQRNLRPGAVESAVKATSCGGTALRVGAVPLRG